MNNYTFDFINNYDSNKFSEMLSCLQSMYNEVREENSRLYKRIQEFDKEEEIQKLQAQYEHLCNHNLHEFSEKELLSYRKFREKHYKSCHNGSTFICTLTATGIGEGIEITCPICGEKEDITDL